MLSRRAQARTLLPPRRAWPLLLLLLGLGVGHELWLGAGIAYSPRSDVAAYLIGAKSVFQKALREDGRFPLWNPAVNAGTPAHASPTTEFTLPSHWAYLVLPVDRATNAVFLLNLLLAGLAMYALALRRLKSEAAAFMCASAYMLGHRALAMVDAGWSTVLFCYALTPLLFWAQDRVLERPAPRRVAALGLVYALGVIQGFPQGFYYSCLASLFFIAWRLARADGALRVKTLAAFAVAAALALLLSAPDLLPRLEFVSLSTRLNYSYDFFIRGAPTLRDLKTLLDPAQAPGLETWENNFYLGLWLYPLGFFALWRRGRRSLPLALACAAPILLCFDSPLSRAAFICIPGFKLFRNHARLLMLVQLAAILLAGQGLVAASGEKDRRGLRVFGAAFAAVAAVALCAAAAWRSAGLAGSAALLALTAAPPLLGRRPGPLFALWLGALPLLDGGLALAPTTKPIDEIFPDQAFYAPLKREVLDGRVAAVGRDAIPYGAAGYLGIDMINGYDGLNLKSFEDYFAVLKYGDAKAAPRAPVVWTDLDAISKPELLRALNVRVLVTQHPAPLERAGFEPAGRHAGVPVFHFYRGMSPETVYVWRDPRPLGPAYFATALRAVSSDAESLDALARSPSPRRADVLGLDRPVGGLALRGGSARRTRHGYGVESYALDSRGENFLILSQIWYPGWRLRLDGREIPAYRVNHALVGCFVPPGRHELDMEMTSPALRRGLRLFAVGAAVFAALTAWPAAARPRRRRARSRT